MIGIPTPPASPVLYPGPRFPSGGPPFRVGHRGRRRAQRRTAAARADRGYGLGLVLLACLVSFLAGMAVVGPARTAAVSLTSGGP